MTTDVVVFGGCGTIGANICKLLLQADQGVVCADLRPELPGLLRRLPTSVRDCLYTEVVDLREASQVRTLLGDTRPWGVINCVAYLPGMTQVSEDINAYLQVNLLGLEHLLCTSQELGLRLVHVSSGSVYSQRPDFHNPYQENEPRNGHQRSLYSLTKHMGDQLCEYYHLNRRLDIRIAHPSRVYGLPAMRADGAYVLPPEHIIPQVLQGRERVELPYSFQRTPDGVMQTGEIRTELSYVKDVANGIILLLQAKRDSLRRLHYNIACGRLYGLEEITEAVRRLFPQRAIQVALLNGAECRRDLRPPLDISAAQQDLGFAPRCLEEAFRDYSQELMAEWGQGSTAVAQDPTSNLSGHGYQRSGGDIHERRDPV